MRPIDDTFPLHLIRDLYSLLGNQFVIEVIGSETSGDRLLVTSQSQEGPPPSELTFDPVTKRISSISTIAYNPKTKRAARSESQFTKYGNFAGTWLPTMMVTYLDGQLFVEKSLLEYTPLEKVDPAEFKPR